MSTVARPLPVDGYALLAQRPPSGGVSVRFLEAFPTAFAALMVNKGAACSRPSASGWRSTLGPEIF